MKRGRFKLEGPHLLLWNLQTRWVSGRVQLRADLEPGLRRRMGNQLDNHFMTNQRSPALILGDMTEHPVFDLVPFARARWQVTDGAPQAGFIRQPRQFDLPPPGLAPVAPAPVGHDQPLLGPGRGRRAQLPPPAAQRFDCKLRRIMIGPDTDPPLVRRQVVDPIRTRAPQLLVDEIIDPHGFRLAYRLIFTAAMGKVSHQCLFLGIDRDHGLAAPLECGHLGMEVLALGVTVWMGAAFFGRNRSRG
jgi:hypothetical protein